MDKSVYRAEIVGSLLRPEWLKAAREARARGQITQADFKSREDQAVDEAIALQERAGLDVVNDGEMRRTMFTSPLSDVVTGISDVPAVATPWQSDAGDGHQRVQLQRAVTDKIRRVRSLAQEEFVYTRAITDRPQKQTLPSPLTMQIFWSNEHSPAAYDDPFDLFADAAQLVRQEITELAEMGCEYVQIDAPELATVIGEEMREVFRAKGIDPDRLITEGVDILNEAVDVPGVRTALHLCRGNREGAWLASGGYDAIASEVFRRATNIDAFFLEFDDERSGDFHPLAEVPADALVVLGLLTTKRGDLESADQLEARLREAADIVPLERLALSTQCGFASTEEGNPLSQEEQRRKLELVRHTADRLWG